MSDRSGPPLGEAMARRAPKPGDNAVRLLSAVDLAFAPASYNAKDGEVEVVWSTGAAVRRYDWWDGVYYDEELDLAGADLARLQAGAPVLTDHCAAVEYVVGSVKPGSVRVVDGQGLATLRFDRSSEEGMAAEAKVAGGHLRNVSIGYRVTTWEKIETEGQPARWIARAWEPFEISFVPVPADAGAGTRGARGAEQPPAQPADPITNRAPDAHIPEARMADKPNPGASQDAPSPANTDDAVRADRARAKEIRSRARQLGLDDTLAETLVDEGLSLEAAAVRMVDALAARTPTAPAGPRVEVVQDHSDPAAIREAMAEELAQRMLPSYTHQNARAQQYRGVRISDMARELATARGERSLPRNPVDFAAFMFGDPSFGGRNMHTTSDFPLLLSSSLNKVLLANYTQAVPTYRRFMARRTFNDFKAHAFLRAGDFPTLLPLLEGGEIKQGTISESGETVTLATFARSVVVTRRVLVNDDLGAFADFGGMIGRRLLDFENATAFAVLNQNSGAGPTLTTGNAVMFSTAAGRLNRAAAGGVIDLSTVATGAAAMAEQTSLDNVKLNLRPRFLLTGTAYMMPAMQITRPVAATQINQENIWAGAFEPLTDANVAGNRWYLFADPAASPCFVYGYLNGASGPQTRTGQPMGRDGFQLDVVLDFAAGGIDWRGGYFNGGA
jgi:hypothetical protein